MKGNRIAISKTNQAACLWSLISHPLLSKVWAAFSCQYVFVFEVPILTKTVLFIKYINKNILSIAKLHIFSSRGFFKFEIV